MNAILRSPKRLIIGLGLTGLSVARWCLRENIAFDLCDTRTQLANLAEIQQHFPQAQIFLGELTAQLLQGYEEIVVSPGVTIQHPAIVAASQAGVRVRGDVDIFAEQCSQPIVAITGSNGKSTVTALVGEMLAQAGLRVAVGGNIGVPVLDLPAADIYVLELSSFQLETTHQLNAAVATILNISEDHLDRYSSFDAYIAAKQRIYQGAQACVVNRDDAATEPTQQVAAKMLSFGLSDLHQGWLQHKGQPLVATAELKIKGQHNAANALAALSIIQALNIQPAQVLAALTEFAGLPYRCQWLGETQGVSFYNDSKGTNVGSTLAAINGLGADCRGKIWLLAGGVDKGQDFAPLAPACQQYVAEVLAFGRDAATIAQALSATCTLSQQETMAEALASGYARAQAGDVILLSPACASFDQFADYMQRGEHFTQLVEALL